MAKHLLLLDASGVAYRAFHARNPTYRESDGMPTWAILGFMEIVYRMLGAARADPISHAAAVFDAPGKTFRHKLYPGYKANRGERPEEITAQLPIMRDAARALGLECVEMAGFEADDVIATLAARGVAAGLRVTIVSSDKDFGQLVKDNEIEIVDPIRKVMIDGVARYGARVLTQDVVDKFGVHPLLVPDVQAMAGDTVDGIPGLPGIGLKKAAALVRRLGPLKAILKEAQKETGYRMEATARLLINRHRSDLRLFRRLTELRQDVELGMELDSLQARTMSVVHIRELLRALEASPRVSQLFEGRGAALPVTTAPALKGDPLDWHREALIERGRKERASSYRSRLAVPDVPQCGFYKRRLIRNGPWVPARIWREARIDFETEQPSGEDTILCEVGGDRRNADDQWNWLLNYPITTAEFTNLMETRAWVQKYAPTEPEANEDRPINWNEVPL